LIPASVIVVRAPATSANLGSGFDCLGLALDLWNEVSAAPGADEVDSSNLILRAARAVFDSVSAPYPGFRLQTVDRIPFSRGLGSSAAAIACGLLIGNHCLGSPLDSDALVDLATRIEGHPDNVTPALLGGVRVAVRDERDHVNQVPIALARRLTAVVFVPEQTVPTAHARGVLPPHVPLGDALFNVGRASLLVAALSSGRFEALAEATRDRLHQPYRLPLFPPGATLLETAMQAGALCAFTSGAGPSILGLCADGRAAAWVAAALSRAAAELSLGGESLRLNLTDRGAHVVN
jgi:homoserine kinase